VFPHDGESYETLLATADNRMYQDKASRKRRSGRSTRGDGPNDLSGVTPSGRSDTDIQRTASGIL
jgi:hypothetical protein